MKINTLIYSTILSLLALQGYTQKAKIAAANKQYDRYAYVETLSDRRAKSTRTWLIVKASKRAV